MSLSGMLSVQPTWTEKRRVHAGKCVILVKMRAILLTGT